mgnify:CR=1 FL=1
MDKTPLQYRRIQIKICLALFSFTWTDVKLNFFIFAICWLLRPKVDQFSNTKQLIFLYSALPEFLVIP